MSLWPNATRILESLGVLGPVIARGDPVTHFNLMRPDGRIISGIPMGGFATPALCIHRADLHRVLREALPESCLEANQRVQSFSQDRDRVTVNTATGRSHDADGLIGADGIHSAIRAQLHGALNPTHRGYCIWRGIAPAIPGGVPGHISETWGWGRRFGILPIGQGRVCWYATRNAEPAEGDAPCGRKAEVQALFRDWHPPIPGLIAATEPGDILRNDARDRPPLRLWGDRRVTLLGDAAHPITPNVGQGACMAIEDAACLARSVLRISSVDAALRDYEASRRSRTARVARQSRFIGAIGQWEHPWVVRGRNLVTRIVLSHSPDMRFNPIYSYEV
jgi:2-polyprenyl-6-methoxyphenol hydroxylase-like FAD-dependent oxidoreductase